MPPKGSKKKPAPKPSENYSSKPVTNSGTVKSKKEITQQDHNDESHKNKLIDALRIRIELLEKKMEPNAFQNSSGTISIGEENLIGMLQGALKTAEEDLCKLRQEVMSSGDGDVPSSDELMGFKETIERLKKEISKKDKEIANMQTELNKEKSALVDMTKQFSDNRHPLKESPRNTSPKAKKGGAEIASVNIKANLTIEATITRQSKDSEIEVLTKKIAQLEFAATSYSQSNAQLLEELKKKEQSIAQLNKDLQSIRQSKDSEIRTLKEQITQLDSTALRDSQSYAKLQEEMRKKDDQLNQELKSIRKQLEEKDSEIQRVQDERNLQLKRLREDHDSKLQSLQREKDNEERLKQKWIDKAQEMENKTERSKSAKDRSDSLQVLLKDNETEIRNKSEEIKQLKTKIQELENAYHEAFDKQESKDKERKKMEDDLRQKLKEKDETINKLRREKNIETTAPVQTNIENLQRDFRKATEEIEELKLRLSKMVGENLTNNNPNITDLSDENRPTKLAEIYSEIYDNEWTDAYEEGEKQGKKEDTIIQELLKILQTSEQYCKEKAEEYLRYLTESASKLHAKASFQSGYTKEYLLKELRKSYAPSFVNEVFSLFIKDKKKNYSKAPKLEAYTKSCIRLCWLMSVQDPQVVLDVVKVPIKFDGDRYKTYTRSGPTMEYVVWPSMLLHTGGPILMKGVAQGK